jgi:hypothetical protein
VKTFDPVFFLVLTLVLVNCTTTPEKPPEFLPKSQSSYNNQDNRSSRYNDIDVNALLTEVGLDHPLEQIGFQERAFNTCQVAANRSKRPLCQRLYVTRLNFQVMCRHSTGTVERVRLTPLTSQKLRWKKDRKRGFTSTNRSGFGSLGFITPYSSRNGHLYLYLGSKIARKRFLDQWKLILPHSWCLAQ